MSLSLALCLVLSYFLVFAESDNSEGPRVETSYGWVQGGVSTTRSGRKISEFLGIKYAKEPTGNLRFKNPEPPETWEGTRPATQECSPCMQNMVLLEALRDKVTGAEDCLCLNVFTPQISENKLPVILFIHGGAYVGFSSDRSMYGPELLLDKDVVLVTINYRLGVLGFLSTEDSVIPGNWGLKDQVAALQWVRDNIAKFGGAPGSVTIMGESAGAACVHLLMLSPLGRGLFHRGIVHSGSALAPWSVARPGLLRSRATQLAGELGCPARNSSSLLSCLQGLSAEKIVATTKTFLVWDIDPVTIWYPTLESHVIELPETQTSSLPLLIGFNYAEGGVKSFSMTSGNVNEKFQQWNSEFQKLTALSLYLNPDLVDEIRNFYFGPAKEITTQMTPQITQLYGDFWFSNGVMDAVELHKGLKFLYFFNFNNSNHFSLFSTIFNSQLYLGTSHFDELPYVFPMGGAYRQVDETLSTKIVEMWTSFAKDSSPGNKVVSWEAVSTPALEYLEISNSYLGMRSCPLKRRRHFYKSLNPYRF